MGPLHLVLSLEARTAGPQQVTRAVQMPGSSIPIVTCDLVTGSRHLVKTSAVRTTPPSAFPNEDITLAHGPSDGQRCVHSQHGRLWKEVRVRPGKDYPEGSGSRST